MKKILMSMTVVAAMFALASCACCNECEKKAEGCCEKTECCEAKCDTKCDAQCAEKQGCCEQKCCEQKCAEKEGCCEKKCEKQCADQK